MSIAESHPGRGRQTVERGLTPEERLIKHPEYRLTREQLTTLVSINPGTEILNKSLLERRFGKDGQNFDPGQFDLPRVVWVQVTPDRKELLIEDGHHRAHTVDTHWDTIQDRHPGFEFKVRDVTQFYIRKRKGAVVGVPSDDPMTAEVTPPTELVVEASAAQPPPALTIEEYLDALIEPTASQPEVASLRVAVTLMKSWDGIVNNANASEKYTALSAFTMLEDIQAGIRGRDLDKQTHRVIDAKGNFFNENTPKEAQAIREGLHRMYDIISRTKVKAKHVAQAAIVILSAKADTIGGPGQAARQVAGLLHTTEIQKKLHREYGSGRERDIAIREISQEIVSVLTTRMAGKEVKGTGIPRLDVVKFNEILYRALLHPRISLQQLRELVALYSQYYDSETVDQKYKEFLTQGFQEDLTAFYTDLIPRGAVISDVEQAIITLYATGLAHRDTTEVPLRDKHNLREQGRLARTLSARAVALLKRLRESEFGDADAQRRITRAHELLSESSSPFYLNLHLEKLGIVLNDEAERLAASEASSSAKGATDHSQEVTASVSVEEVLVTYLNLPSRLRGPVREGNMTLEEAVLRHETLRAARSAGANGSSDGSSGNHDHTLPESVGLPVHILKGISGIKTRLRHIEPHNVIGPVADDLREVVKLALGLLGSSGELELTPARERELVAEVAQLKTRLGAAEAYIKTLEGASTVGQLPETGEPEVIVKVTELPTEGTVFKSGGNGLEESTNRTVSSSERGENRRATTIEEIDDHARKLFGINEVTWQSVLADIIQGEEIGIDVIDKTLTERLNNVLGVVRDRTGNSLTIDSAETQLMIADHYLEFLTKPTPLKGAMRAKLMTFMSDQRLPLYSEYREVLKMLLYTDPESTEHAKAAEFVASKVKKEERANSLIATFLRSHEMRDMRTYVRNVLGIAVTKK